MLYVHGMGHFHPENIIDNVRGNNTSIVLRDGTFWVQGFNAGLTLNF